MHNAATAVSYSCTGTNPHGCVFMAVIAHTCTNPTRIQSAVSPQIASADASSSRTARCSKDLRRGPPDHSTARLVGPNGNSSSPSHPWPNVNSGFWAQGRKPRCYQLATPNVLKSDRDTKKLGHMWTLFKNGHMAQGRAAPAAECLGPELSEARVLDDRDQLLPMSPGTQSQDTSSYKTPRLVS